MKGFHVRAFHWQLAQNQTYITNHSCPLKKEDQETVSSQAHLKTQLSWNCQQQRIQLKAELPTWVQRKNFPTWNKQEVSQKPQLQEKKFQNLEKKISKELQLQGRISIASIIYRKKKILKKNLSSTKNMERKLSSTCWIVHSLNFNSCRRRESNALDATKNIKIFYFIYRRAVA